MENREELERIRQMYRPEIEVDQQDTGAAWHPRNPVSIYFRQAQERAIANLLNLLHLDLTQMTILDFGCGSGVEMRFMVSLGARVGCLYAFDVMEHRVRKAQALSPAGIHLLVANGEVVPFQDQVFDLVYQFVVFSSIFDAQARAHAAREIVRLLKPGGRLIWYDINRGVRNAGFMLDLTDLANLFPAMNIIYSDRLHAVRLSSVVRRSWTLAAIWDRLPLIRRSHLLVVLQKPG